jgi:putative ABC transport system ATP-binding protein
LSATRGRLLCDQQDGQRRDAPSNFRVREDLPAVVISAQILRPVRYKYRSGGGNDRSGVHGARPDQGLQDGRSHGSGLAWRGLRAFPARVRGAARTVGSGKSTLLNILGGLDVPSSGEVIYKGTNLTAASDAELTEYRRTHVGFVFQFYNLIPSLTARENVALVTDIVRQPMTAAEALTMVGLEHRLDHFPAQLSGGEQQRVAIARAIAKRPAVLLCDEPTGALDITTGIVVLDALARVNRELGTATVVITHNAAISAMADRIVRLFDGQIAGIDVNTTRLAASELQW